jgi:hypothetical protein
MTFGRCRAIIFCSLTVSTALALAGAADLAACTLWAAAGERAAHGGSLIAKNRDWVPEPDEVRLVNSPQGFRFLGLFPVREGKRPGAVAGVNEKGLVVVVASAGSIPPEARRTGGPGLMRRLLTECPSVEEVLARRSLFARIHPAIYLLADTRRIAWVEVGPEGRYAVRETASGVLAHTNHYLDASLVDANRKVGRSSRARLGKIGELLGNRTAPLTLEDFIAFSGDRSDGPDDSIWRTGGKPERERTIASWIVSLPKEAPTEFFIRLADLGKAVKEARVTLDAAFWKRPEGVIFKGDGA